MKHIAYNIDTCEVIVTTSVNHLKRCVKRNNTWNIRHGYDVGEWRFAHGVDAYRKLQKRLGIPRC